MSYSQASSRPETFCLGWLSYRHSQGQISTVSDIYYISNYNLNGGIPSCCLPRRIGPCANIDSVNCRSASRLHRYLCPRIDPCKRFPSSMAHGSFAPICDSGSPRNQRSCGRFGFHSGLSTLGNWLSDPGTRRRNKFGHGAMVGCYCCLDIYECGMVRSGNLDWDRRRWYTGPMLVWRS
jgi:hypothetical protein